MDVEAHVASATASPSPGEKFKRCLSPAITARGDIGGFSSCYERSSKPARSIRIGADKLWAGGGFSAESSRAELSRIKLELWQRSREERNGSGWLCGGGEQLWEPECDEANRYRRGCGG